MPLSKIAEEAESQEYLDAVEKMEPKVEDLARRIVDNLDIDISSPDGDAWCILTLVLQPLIRILYFFLNEDPLFFVDVFFAWMSSI